MNPGICLKTCITKRSQAILPVTLRSSSRPVKVRQASLRASALFVTEYRSAWDARYSDDHSPSDSPHMFCHDDKLPFENRSKVKE